MRRRTLLGGMAALPVLGRSIPGSAATEAANATPSGAGAFDAGTVRGIAKALAAKPYQAPDTKLPDALAHLTYDQYRAIRFDPGHALWRGEKRYFEVQFFHRGFLFNQRVDIFQVADGQSTPILYSPDLFDFGPNVPRPAASGGGGGLGAGLGADLGFAGFRVHAPINRPDYYDEICVYLGASYFRAVAKGQGYGLSARGLAINTGDPKGEEFPAWRSFWLERPAVGTEVLVIHALLDSPGAAASFRFSIRPGEQTIFDTEMTLYPRADLPEVGLAPLTSMFDFDALERRGVDDWRTAVHDSDGLAVWTGRGEYLWRPLSNPRTLQASGFGDTGPRGFGLMQRHRKFAEYDDLEAHYERRPSLWVEPIGDAGPGAVMLLEIPAKGEVNDNIVSFWRPKETPVAHAEYTFTYRLHWCALDPFDTGIGRVIDSRNGTAFDGKGMEFVIDYAGGRLKDLAADAVPKLDVTADHGKLTDIVAQPNPATGGWRLAFELDPAGATTIELRAVISDAAGPLAETWLYRWTA